MYPPPRPPTVYDHALPSDVTATPLATAIAALLSTTISGENFVPAATITAVAASTAAVMQGPDDGPKDGGDNGECKLLGPFALLVQAALGAFALLALVWKRYRERPQRPLKVWWFDVSKQVVGSALLHLANLLMSMLSAGQFQVTAESGIQVSNKKYTPNPCSFYLLNIAVDTTIGIPILVIFLRVLTHAFSGTPLGNPPESIKSGNYDTPPRAGWWVKQCFIYFCGLLGMKICVFFLFELLPWLGRVGDWALRWTEGNERVQVFFVMLLFPVIMNALQYYIIDSFIKGQVTEEHPHRPLHNQDSDEEDHDDNDSDQGASDEETRGRRRDSRGASTAAVSSSFATDAETTKRSVSTTTREIGSTRNSSKRGASSLSKARSSSRRHPQVLEEYNPDTDGDEQSQSREDALRAPRAKELKPLE
ncbi:hypothetical protein L228DRAFT_259632 [Xylona heveae TC161]|uniref:Vacuolar membrane protein n=1 Tax=Xylona heveae (strain CBS 132557 / TC161) TaxID=1328760 RepID=A0A165I599_XYLHT|nr:hypothetical protein L228DRAFT_259632 [Xylona heveae TC161]KZF24404.1 hypothetical protein L228DRAFT_259632 [Xylona heveae TC161]